MNKVILVILAVTLVTAVGLGSVAYAQSDEIPKWIKGVADYWINDKITDSDFTEAMGFLINSGVITVDNNPSQKVNNHNIELEQKNQQLENQILELQKRITELEQTPVITQNTDKIQSQLEICIELELDGFVLINDMINHTNSQNLPPNSFDVYYPEPMIDELSHITQQSFLNDCLSLALPMYLDHQVKLDGRALINNALDAIDKYGYDEFDEYEKCALDPMCPTKALATLGNNSVMYDVLLLTLFLQLDVFIM